MASKFPKKPSSHFFHSINKKTKVVKNAKFHARNLVCKNEDSLIRFLLFACITQYKSVKGFIPLLMKNVVHVCCQHCCFYHTSRNLRSLVGAVLYNAIHKCHVLIKLIITQTTNLVNKFSGATYVLESILSAVAQYYITTGIQVWNHKCISHSVPACYSS